jgi:hypothetical protein
MMSFNPIIDPKSSAQISAAIAHQQLLSFIEIIFGTCPTGKHVTDFRQCGFAGCINLRPWANANRYRYWLEESYRAENSAHVRGDGRWFVEVLCQHGLIYPYGGPLLLAYAKPGVVSKIASLPDVRPHQTDGRACVFKFPLERLHAVAAILKPKKLRGSATLTPRQLEVLREGRKRLDKTGANQFLTHDRRRSRGNPRVTLNRAIKVSCRRR